MNDGGRGGAPEEESGSWTSETLPLSVRRELLERELRKLGFRKAGHPGGSMQQQQQQQPQPQENASHPSARADDETTHAD